MARSEISVRCTHVSGLAICLACGTLVSWLLSWRELDRVQELRCPCCHGTCDVERHTAVALVERAGARRIAG